MAKTIEELELEVQILTARVDLLTRPSNAALALQVQELVDKMNTFANQQIFVYTTSDPTAPITGSDDIEVVIPSWASVQKSTGYDMNVYERNNVTAGMVLFRSWPNQRIALPAAEAGWTFTSAAGQNAVLQIVKINRLDQSRTVVGTATITNGVGSFSLQDHTLDYNEGISLEVQSGTVSGFIGTLRYIYMV